MSQWRVIGALTVVGASLSAANGCGGSGGTSTVITPPPPPAISVTISPGSSELPLGGFEALSASVTGTGTPGVTWTVLEGTVAGSITAAGVFSASRTSGTYHVVATSVADVSKSATATVNVHGISVDDLIADCPTALEALEFSQREPLIIDDDPTAPTLVCTAANGSADLTRLQERMYQAFKVIKNVPLNAQLPWTDRRLNDWFTSVTFAGIRLRSDIQGSFCCDPPSVINIPVTNLAALQTNRWIDPAGGGLDGLVMLLVHEARHIDFGPHDCGSNDQNLSEVGAWGAQYYTEEWFSFHSGTFNMPTLPAPSRDYYQSSEWNNAQVLRNTRFCNTPPILVAPGSIDFRGQILNTSASRAIAITAGTANSVTVSALALSGDMMDFTLTGTNCTGATLPPSCTATVTFTPTSEGVKSATLSFTNSSTTSPLSATLRGTGGALVTMYSPPEITLAPGTNYEFAADVTGAQSDIVLWSITEGATGGSILPQASPFDFAIYTAPMTPGTYHVVASSFSDPAKTASSTVTVQ